MEVSPFSVPLVHRKGIQLILAKLIFWTMLILMAGPGAVLAQGSPPGIDDEVEPALLVETVPVPSSQLPARARGQGVAGTVNIKAWTAGRLRLKLPDGRVLVVKRTQDSRGPRGEHSWIGEFENMPYSLFSITRHQGHISGTVRRGNEVWEIESQGGGRARLFQVDETRLPPEGPVRSSPKQSAPASTSKVEIAAATVAAPVVHDLLVVYTPATATRYGGSAALQSKILDQVNSINTAYSNSKVGIHLNLVDMREISYIETGDMNVSLSRLQVNGDGYLDGVHNLRDSLGADLVALLTTDSNYCGIAYVPADASGAPLHAFSVVWPECFSTYTFAHELGHNQGNAHDRVSSGGVVPPYPYAYGYRTCDYPAQANGQDFRTLMSYSCGSSPVVNLFSNPSILFNGVAPMGIAHEANPSASADSARSMNELAPLIAGYRSAPAATLPSAPSGLTVTAATATSLSLAWTDNSANESGFMLQRSIGGGAFTTRATLGPNVRSFQDMGLTPSTTYSYRLQAYNSAGTSGLSNTITRTTPALPAVPSPASLSKVGRTITLRWTNVENEVGYRVQRETYDAVRGIWVGISTYAVAANITSFNQNLAIGRYRYRVRSYNSSGNSKFISPTCIGTGCLSDGSIRIN